MYSNTLETYVSTKDFNFRSFKCNRKNCKACDVINNNNCFVSNTTNKCFSLNINDNCNCNTTGVVYLIQCTCGLQYIGKTYQMLKTRFRQHIYNIQHNSQTIFHKHMRLIGHDIKNCKLFILEHIIEENISILNQKLLEKEDFWIKTLNSMYPLGLNDVVQGIGRSSIVHNKQLYYNNPVKRKPRSHGDKRNKKNRVKNIKKDMYINEQLEILKQLLRDNKLKDLYVNIRSFSKDIICSINQRLINDYDMLSCIIDSYCNTKYYKRTINVNNNNRKYTLTINFINKCIDNINIVGLLNNSKSKEIIGSDLSKYIPKIRYKLLPPLGRKICNYNKELKSICNDNIRNIMETECNCKSLSFDKINEHICTHNLELIENCELRKLLSKGYKYRLNNNNDKNKIYNSLYNDLNAYFGKLINSESSNISKINIWKDYIFDKIKNKMKITNNYKRKDKINKDMYTELTKLKDNYIITTIDKASNNYVFICKKLYYDILMKEVNSNDLNVNPTYERSELSLETIITSHCSIMDKKGITVESDNKTIPILYWIPKLHKNPIKPRFICSAFKCTLKPLSVYMNKILKVIKAHFKKYCKVIEINTGIKHYFSINSTKEFLEQIKGINFQNINTYDFSTLYTNLDLVDIKEALVKLINLIFGKRYTYICYNNYNAYLTKIKPSSKYKYMDKIELIESLNILINQNYLKVGTSIFRQVKGVPMGGNSSPIIADLFLSFIEYEFVHNCVKTKSKLYKDMKYMFRYIDDICVFNSNNFYSISEQIYPESLILNKTNIDDKEGVYLDMNIKLTLTKTTINLYRKDDIFKFTRNIFLHEHSCIPYNIKYNTLNNEILRIATICNDIGFLQNHLNNLIDTYFKLGYYTNNIKQKIVKYINQHNNIKNKFKLLSGKFLWMDNK